MAAEQLKLREWNTGPKIYIGQLGENTDKFKIAELFQPYGKLKNVIVAKNPPGFAFVEFEETKHAEDAYKAIYGERVSGSGGPPASANVWKTKDGSNMNIKPPTESRPEDWLCPKEGCNNVNFEWRKSCNNCNTRKPGFEGETDDERRQRVYGSQGPRNHDSGYHRDSRSHDRDRSGSRGRGYRGPSGGRDERERSHDRNRGGRGYHSDRGRSRGGRRH